MMGFGPSRDRLPAARKFLAGGTPRSRNGLESLPETMLSPAMPDGQPGVRRWMRASIRPDLIYTRTALCETLPEKPASLAEVVAWQQSGIYEICEFQRNFLGTAHDGRELPGNNCFT